MNITKIRHALLAFYAPWGSHSQKLQPKCERAAKRMKEEGVAVDTTKAGDLAMRCGVSGLPIRYFYRGYFKWDAGHLTSEEKVVQCMKDPQEPRPPELPESCQETVDVNLIPSNFEDKLLRIKAALVMFYAPWCIPCKGAQFADDDGVGFFAFDCNEQRPACSKEHATKGYEYSAAMRYYNFMNNVDECELNRGKRELESALFIHSHKEQRAKAATPSEAGFGGNVTILGDHNFLNTIKAATPTFVIFYASFCSHCAIVKPVFSKLATTLITEKYRTRAVAVDAADNPMVADYANIEMLPTFKIYMAGNQVGVYTGDRSFDDMLAFCKTFESKV